MPAVSVKTARDFVDSAELPHVSRSRGDIGSAAVELALNAGKNQAAIVGSDIVSFVSGVTVDRREAIINSSLLAQLVAKKKVDDPSRIYDWYEAYFDVLTNIGWVVQDKSFAEYREQSQNFDAHKAILSVAAVLLGAAPTALALVTTTIEALQSMDASSPWITVFNRESHTAKTGRFQISLAEQEADGQFFVTLMAFGLEADSTVTQVLFFKARAEDVTLRHYSGRVTINGTVLDGVRDALKAKLADSADQYIKKLPDF